MTTNHWQDRDRKHARRVKTLTRHHIINKCRGGSDSLRNIIRLRQEKHQAWHLIFGNMSFQEAALLLIRAEELVKSKLPQ